MNVTRNIILTADGSKALSTINQVDGRIAAMSSPGGSIGKLAGVLKFAGVAAAVTAVFGTITKNVLKFSGQLDKVDAQLKAVFKDKNEVLGATKELMASYDYTKVQTQQYLATMASKISEVVSEKNLAKASTGAIRVAQRISSLYGISLENAMDVVARAMQGHTKGLERYGIAIDRNVRGSLRILGSMEEATAKYEQVIEAQKNTIKWQLDNMNNTVKAGWTKIAAVFDSILGPVLRKLNEIIGGIQIGGLDTQIEIVKKFFTAFTASLDNIREPLQYLTDAFMNLGSALLQPIASLAESPDSVNDAIQSINQVIESLGTVVLLISDVVDLWTKMNFGVKGFVGPLTTIKWTLRAVNSLLIFARLGFKAVSSTIGFIIDLFNGIISSIKNFSLDKLKDAWKNAGDNFSKNLNDAYETADKAIDRIADGIAKEWTEKLDKTEIKVNTDKVPKAIELDAPAVSTTQAQKAVQQGVNKMFDGISAPVQQVQQVVKVANTLDLAPMTKQLEVASKAVNTFVESLKNLKITQTIIASFDKIKENIETSLNDVGNLELIKDAGETLSEAAIAFKAAVESFNSNPQQEELINEAKQSNVYLEQISRNLVGVNAFA